MILIPIGSMYAIYAVPWIPSIYPLYVNAFFSQHQPDPSWDMDPLHFSLGLPMFDTGTARPLGHCGGQFGTVFLGTAESTSVPSSTWTWTSSSSAGTSWSCSDSATAGAAAWESWKKTSLVFSGDLWIIWKSIVLIHKMIYIYIHIINIYICNGVPLGFMVVNGI